MKIATNPMSLTNESSRRQLDQPVFVVGSGRSGTTLVGELLGKHPDVLYLNEPRKLWNTDPRTNIWEGSGQILLEAQDLTADIASRLRRKLAHMVDKAQRARLVEKTPINAFRIGYLNALCPDARFLHVVRDGRDVAASIARLAAAPKPTPWLSRLTGRNPGSRWYGSSGVKWQRLEEIASREGIDASLISDDLIARGLLEWSLAVTFARRSLDSLDRSRWAELRYEDLMIRPGPTMRTTLEALDLPPCDSVVDEASCRVRPPSQDAQAMDLSCVALASGLMRELGYAD